MGQWWKQFLPEKHRNIYLAAAHRRAIGRYFVPFLTGFEFSDDTIASMLMFYNAILIYTVQVLIPLAPENLQVPYNPRLVKNAMLDGYPADLPENTKDDYVAAERLAAPEVCPCIPNYFVQKIQSEAGHWPVVYVATTAAWMTLLDNGSAEGRWMEALLNSKSRLNIPKI